MKDDGGSAFPFHEDISRGNNFRGMTLRDYFAVKALQYQLHMACQYKGAPINEFCMASYEWADTMIEARKK